MDSLTAIFALIDGIMYFIERSDMTREEKDEMNRKIREKFDSLLPPQEGLKDTWP